MENVNFIGSFFIGFLGATLFKFLEIFVTKKYNVISEGEKAINKEFKIYKKIYLNICKNQFGEKISKEQAKLKIEKLISEIDKDDELFILLSPQLMQWLIFCKKNPNTDKISDIQYQIEIDFNNLCSKLGYFSKLKNSIFVTVFSVIFFGTILGSIIYIFIMPKNEYSFYIYCIITIVVVVELIIILRNEPTYRTNIIHIFKTKRLHSIEKKKQKTKDKDKK